MRQTFLDIRAAGRAVGFTLALLSSAAAMPVAHAQEAAPAPAPAAEKPAEPPAAQPQPQSQPSTEKPAPETPAAPKPEAAPAPAPAAPAQPQPTEAEPGAAPAPAPEDEAAIDNRVFALVVEKAQKLAASAYQPPKTWTDAELGNLTYDDFRNIRFRPEKALWHDQSLFEVQFFHMGFLFKQAVDINVVDDGNVMPLAFDKSMFRYDSPGIEEKVPNGLGYAGFRVHFPINNANYKDEVAVFLGASYFRLLARNEVYGLSARGLAVDTATSRGEEFPAFREFWLVKPAPGATQLVIYALLDSQSVTGAYRFVLKPGTKSVTDVDATLFFRDGGHKFGIAPLTSMYLYGDNAHTPFDDYRPEVHDSDGLLMHTGRDEWIWRPLVNPKTLRVSAFLDENPKGFGLMQRDRDPSHYLDLESHYERRPSIWVEPRDVPWGKGSVQVVEIPSNEEIHDNMVAFWAFDKPFQSGSSVKLSYSLIAADSVDEEEGALARVDRTRIGWGGVAGAANPLPKTVKRFLIDFRGGDLATFDGTQPVSAEVHNTKGKIDDVAVTKVPGTDLWRLSFRLTPDGDQPADMRIFLKLRDQRLTETWSYLYAPSAVE